MNDVLKNMVVTLRHVFHGNENFASMKRVREYRAKIRSKFRRVTETLQVLETDSAGNGWLVMCVMEISPN